MTRGLPAADDSVIRARDVMSSPVITLPPRATVRAAAALLVSHGYSAAPVVDAAGRIVGIASEADLIEDEVDHDGHEDERTVAEVMTESPYLLSPEADLQEVAALLARTRIRTVPIVDGAALVGIVTRRDILRAIAQGDLGRGIERIEPAALLSRGRGAALGTEVRS